MCKVYLRLLPVILAAFSSWLTLFSSSSSFSSSKSSRLPMSACFMLIRLARLCMSSSLRHRRCTTQTHTKSLNKQQLLKLLKLIGERFETQRSPLRAGDGLITLPTGSFIHSLFHHHVCYKLTLSFHLYKCTSWPSKTLKRLQLFSSFPASSALLLHYQEPAPCILFNVAYSSSVIQHHSPIEVYSLPSPLCVWCFPDPETHLNRCDWVCLCGRHHSPKG